MKKAPVKDALRSAVIIRLFLFSTLHSGAGKPCNHPHFYHYKSFTPTFSNNAAALYKLKHSHSPTISSSQVNPILDYANTLRWQCIRKTRTVKAKNMTEAKKMLASFVTEVGEYIDPSKMKFGFFVDEWRSKYAERKLSAGTVEVYNYYLKGHILPEFGHRRIDQIIPMHVTDYLISLETAHKDGKEGGLAPATIQKHYNLLSSIFQFAKRNGLIKDNPVENAEKPVAKKAETDVYTTNEVHELFKLLEKEEAHHELMIRLAIETGMRRGELLGLQWDDINFETNKISINHSFSYTKEKGYLLGDTKSKKKRVVTSSKGMMEKL